MIFSITDRRSRLIGLLCFFLPFTLLANNGPGKPTAIVAICNEYVNVALSPSGTATILPEYIDQGSYDTNGPISSMSVSPDFFDCEDVGQTFTVTLTVNGPSGPSSCWSLVTIEDKYLPTAVCESDVFISLPPSGSFVLPGEFVAGGSVDNCPGSLTYSLSQSLFTCDDIGASVISVVVTDGDGNSNTCLSTIHVKDNIPPTAICQSDVFVNIGPSGYYLINPTDFDAGSYDNCGLVELTITTDKGVYGCEDVGQLFVIELDVNDFNGNSASCLSVLHVEDANPDSDCDGISNVCDVCAGGNDTVDNNGDGLPDCANAPAFAQIIPAWKCGSNKVYICKNNKTKCINYAALAAQMASGALLGPCGNASCSEGLQQSGYASDDAVMSIGVQMRNTQVEVAIEDLNTQGTLVMTDQLGRIIFSKPVAANSLSEILDFTNIQNGLYYISLRANGTQVTEKIAVFHGN
jgi:hypothetical protein